MDCVWIRSFDHKKRSKAGRHCLVGSLICMIGVSRNHFPLAFEKSIVASVAQRDCTHSFHTWPPPLYAFYSAWYTPNSPSIVGKSLYTTILLFISLYHYFPLYLYLGYLLYSVFPGIVYTIVYMYTLYVSSSHGESSWTNFCENGSNFRMLFWKQFCPDLSCAKVSQIENGQSTYFHVGCFEHLWEAEDSP